MQKKFCIVVESTAVCELSAIVVQACSSVRLYELHVFILRHPLIALTFTSSHPSSPLLSSVPNYIPTPVTSVLENFYGVPESKATSGQLA
jgi:hypothetical protein